MTRIESIVRDLAYVWTVYIGEKPMPIPPRWVEDAVSRKIGHRACTSEVMQAWAWAVAEVDSLPRHVPPSLVWPDEPEVQVGG